MKLVLPRVFKFNMWYIWARSLCVKDLHISMKMAGFKMPNSYSSSQLYLAWGHSVEVLLGICLIRSC